jgi:hypothetical protein
VFELDLASADPLVTSYRLYINFTVSSGSLTEYIQYSDGGAIGPDVNPLPAIPRGVWKGLTVDVDFASAHVEIDYDGKLVSQMTLHPPSQSAAQTVSFGVTGMDAPAGATEWQVRDDNVACTVTP